MMQKSLISAVGNKELSQAENSKESGKTNQQKAALGQLFASLLQTLQGQVSEVENKETEDSSALADLLSGKATSSEGQEMDSALAKLINKIKAAIGDTEGLSEEEIIAKVEELINAGVLSAKEIANAINKQLAKEEKASALELAGSGQSKKNQDKKAKQDKKNKTDSSAQKGSGKQNNLKLAEKQGKGTAKQISGKQQEAESSIKKNIISSGAASADSEESKSAKKAQQNIAQLAGQKGKQPVSEDAAKSLEAKEKSGETGKKTVQLTEKQKKLLSSFITGEKTTQQTSVQSSSMQAEQAMQKEAKRSQLPQNNRGRSQLGFLNQQEGRRQISGLFGANFLGTGNSGSDGQEMQFSDNSDILWKNNGVELQSAGKEKGSERASFNFGQMPIGNAKLRKQILPTLSQKALNASAKAKENPGTWQKHNFVLDDGQKLQLSVREVKGVLHVKLGAGNLDLSKLLQQYQQQIKEHLEQKFGSSIDLQFDNQQQSSAFADDSLLSGGDGQSQRPTLFKNDSSSQQADKVLVQSVRKFGYNQMEWTA